MRVCAWCVTCACLCLVCNVLFAGKTEEEARKELQAAGMNEDEIAKLVQHKVFLG